MNRMTVQFMFVCLASSMPAIRAADEVSIESCSRIGFDFKISPYLTVAKSLQSAGSDKAIVRLRSWADTRKYEDQVVILCRMLFEAKQGSEFRRPLIGGAILAEGAEDVAWPLEPIDIYEGVPILLAWGYVVDSKAELSRIYLDFCLANCNWREAHYSARSQDELEGIVAKWLTSRKWPVPLSDRDQRFFTAQAEYDGGVEPATRSESK